jgi:hypothetical protein
MSLAMRHRLPLAGTFQQRGLDGGEVAKDCLARAKARYAAGVGFIAEPRDGHAQPPSGYVDRHKLGGVAAHDASIVGAA